MTVKELIKKYPNYQVLMMGYPNCIPYTCLPEELRGLHGRAFMRVANGLEVKGYEAHSVEFDSVSLVDGEVTHYKGTLEIYLKGAERK